MYNVSARYKEKMFEPSNTRRITGTVGGVAFTDKDILKGSFDYSNKCVGGNDIHLGGVYIGELNLTFTKRIISAINRGSWQGLEIDVSVGLLIDANTWEDVPVGRFTISEANWGKSGIEIKAYDNMSKFDKACDFNVTSGNMYALLNYACTKCGVALGMTQAEVGAMVNGSEILGLYPISDIETYRDLISWLAQTACAFATVDRSGGLVLRTLGNNININIDATQRKSGCTFSDFVTFYSAITVENIENETISTYRSGLSNGLVMELGGNPFLQFGLDAVKNKMRQSIADKLAEFRYTPFRCTSFRDISFDLGDFITFRGMTAGTSSKGCIMSVGYSFKDGLEMQGYGDNPMLIGAKGKQDKNNTSSRARMKADTISWLQYVNITEIDAGSDRAKIASLRFSTEKESDADIWLETKLNTFFVADSNKIKATITYVMDGEEISYQPVETWNIDEEHTLHYGYHFNKLDSIAVHQIDVYLEMAGATAIIEPECSKLVLSALGIIKDIEWDGVLEFEDSFKISLAGSMRVPNFEDDVQTELQVPMGASFTDTFSIGLCGTMGVNLVDNLDIISRFDLSYRITEDGIDRITEDLESLRVTEYRSDSGKKAVIGEAKIGYDYIGTEDVE